MGHIIFHHETVSPPQAVVGGFTIFSNVTVKNFGGIIRVPPAAGMVGAKLMIYRYLVSGKTFSPSYPQRYPRTYPQTHPTSLPGLGVAGRTLKAEWRTP